jgi:hypothetical protein
VSISIAVAVAQKKDSGEAHTAAKETGEKEGRKEPLSSRGREWLEARNERARHVEGQDE